MIHLQSTSLVIKKKNLARVGTFFKKKNREFPETCCRRFS